jgi:DNA-binding NtrC family response regulator
MIVGRSAKPTILLTEDDGATRDAITEVLVDDGYLVVAVLNIAEARARIADEPFTVLLLDSRHVEGEHGVDWLKDFVGHEGAPRTIIVSGSNDAGALGERFGVRVVRKPFDIDELVAAIVNVTDSNLRARDRDQ